MVFTFNLFSKSNHMSLKCKFDVFGCENSEGDVGNTSERKKKKTRPNQERHWLRKILPFTKSGLRNIKDYVTPNYLLSFSKNNNSKLNFFQECTNQNTSCQL